MASPDIPDEQVALVAGMFCHAPVGPCYSCKTVATRLLLEPGSGSIISAIQLSLRLDAWTASVRQRREGMTGG